MCDQFRWESGDMAVAEIVRLIESPCMFSASPGRSRYDWVRAFKALT
jgi:hypothetical protein